MSLLPKSIHRCRRYPTKFNSGRDIPLGPKGPSKLTAQLERQIRELAVQGLSCRTIAKRLCRGKRIESSIMRMPMQPLTLLVVAIAGWIQRDQQAALASSHQHLMAEAPHDLAPYSLRPTRRVFGGSRQAHSALNPASRMAVSSSSSGK